MLDLAVRGARVVREDGVAELEIGVADGTIVAVAADVGGARAEIDAGGLLALPAAIDPHVHLNEPGRTSWEGFATGSAALAAGGGSVLLDMPLNSEPPVLDAEAFAAKQSAAEASCVTDFGLWGGLTPGNVDRLESLADAGVVGLKAFMSDSGIASFPPADDHTLWRGMRIAAARGLVVAVHAENDAITRMLAHAARTAGDVDAAAWTASRPAVAETEAIERALHFAADTGAKLHVVHVSTPEGARRIAAARARGVDVTSETCPHYLHFTAADAARIGIALKCAPPVRDGAARDGLWTAVRERAIDFVASDHSPAPPDLKRGADWFAAWGGVAGIQQTLQVLLEHHRRGAIELTEIPRLAASAAALRFGLRTKGRIAPGFDADLALIRPEASPVRLDAAHLHQRHPITPYLEEAFAHTVVRTLRRGETIFADGRIATRRAGRLLRPGTASGPDATAAGLVP